MFIFRRLRHSQRHLSNLSSLSSLMGTMLINAPSKFLLNLMCIFILCRHIGQNSVFQFSKCITSFDNFLFFLYGICQCGIVLCLYTFTHLLFCLGRCKKMVTASKRFTIHRSSNVLTVSLKRFTNFNGGKITKVHFIKVITQKFSR